MNLELLKRLCETPGVPGREHRIRALIQNEIDGLFDEVRVDPMGSLICVRHARDADGAALESAPRTMVAAHMDQIGFLVRHLEKDGWLRVQPVGGFDPRVLFARRVRVCPDLNDPAADLPGVLNPGGKPLHVSTPEERKKVPELAEFYIDLAMDADAVRERVRIGDMVVLDARCDEVGDAVVSQALDNRVACWLVIEAVRELVGGGGAQPSELHVVFTVQEEVGLRGAMASAYTVKPDIGIAVDTTLCVDTPGVPEDQRCSVFGGGVALTVMDGSAIADAAIVDRMEALCEAHGIPHQRSLMARGGTDAGGMQRQVGGVRTFTLSVPTRYIHTVTEMIHRRDMAAGRDLLAAYLREGQGE